MAFQFNANQVLGANAANLLHGEPDYACIGIGMNDTPLEFGKSKASRSIVDVDRDDSSASQSPSDAGKQRLQQQHRNLRSSRERSRDKSAGKQDDDRSGSDSIPQSLSADIAAAAVAAAALQNGNGGAIVSAGLSAPNVWSSMMNMGYPMVGMNMLVDPTNMMSMNNYGMIPPTIIAAAAAAAATAPGPPPDTHNLLTDPSTAGHLLMNPAPGTSNSAGSGPLVKEIVHCKSCTLFPPNPSAPLPTTRERPPGCRTIFVGGLPENITEDIIREVFERCGEITTLRLSKKNFCHIRFLFEGSVDAAIFLSGYRIRIGSNTDAPNTGRLHVDYAQARDDQYEWECRQRQLQREQRHRERMEEERLRPPSPPPVVHFTDHEASSVAEKLKLDDTFSKAVQILLTWLERGDCSKRNSNTFYSMIQSTNSHVRRLISEKNQYEDELRKAKEIMKGRMQGILLQFSQIERVFMAACHKKVWDHFTKAQRKNIELWKKQSTELKNVQIDDGPQAGCGSGGQGVAGERADDEMDMSDGEDSSTRVSASKRARLDSHHLEERNCALKEENDNLRCQMEAYKNEVEVVKVDLRKEIDDKEKQFKMLQNTLQGMQQQLMEAKRRQCEEEVRVKELQTKLQQQSQHSTERDVVTLDDSEPELIDSFNESTSTCSATVSVVPSVVENTTTTTSASITPPSTVQPFDERDAKLVGIISTFLNVHPFGAGLDYIWSYVTKMEANLKPSDIEVLMTRFPKVFRQEVLGIGANIERRWLFNAFGTADD